MLCIASYDGSAQSAVSFPPAGFTLTRDFPEFFCFVFLHPDIYFPSSLVDHGLKQSFTQLFGGKT